MIMGDEMSQNTDYDVIIIGGGAAGLSAALYSVRAMLKTLVLEKFASGGQILYTDVIENYPGFPAGITGPESKPRAQASDDHRSQLYCEGSDNSYRG